MGLYDEVENLDLILNVSAQNAWVDHSAKRPISAQVMISQFVGSSPTSGSVLTAWSLLGILPPSLCCSPVPCSQHSFSRNKNLKK